eukprot:NODE_849_length_1339_cov_290.320872.p1 GENE.NODE_849_length_1339_cov_290.320872~~NODE_849_length_1339_cov_290.320872.p1  ORF type:complete len:381 (-),score=112.01 NODE_849_length_1339_cov_290.320872:180-1265(-)
MFSDVSSSLDFEAFSAELQVKLDGLLSSKFISNDAIAKYLDAARELETRFGEMIEAKVLKRPISAKYGSFPIELQVHTLAEETALRMAAAVKTACLGAAGGVKYFDFEATIHTTLKAGRPSNVDEALVEKWNIARSAFSSFLERSGSELSAEGLRVVLDRKRGELLDLDDTWYVEDTFLRLLAGNVGQSTIQQQILAGLPGERRTPTLAEALKHVEQVSHGPMLLLASRETSMHVKSAVEMLSGMLRGFEAPFASPQPPFLMPIVKAARDFCVHGVGVKRCTGPKAAALMLKDLQATKPTLVALKSLAPYAQMLETDDMATFRQMVKEAYAGALPAPPPSQPSQKRAKTQDANPGLTGLFT